MHGATIKIRVHLALEYMTLAHWAMILSKNTLPTHLSKLIINTHF